MEAVVCVCVCVFVHAYKFRVDVNFKYCMFSRPALDEGSRIKRCAVTCGACSTAEMRADGTHTNQRREEQNTTQKIHQTLCDIMEVFAKYWLKIKHTERAQVCVVLSVAPVAHTRCGWFINISNEMALQCD